MSTPARATLTRRGLLVGTAAVLGLAACRQDADQGPAAVPAETLRISAIPDQDPELLNRLYPAVAERFAAATGLEVDYRPLTDYAAVVRAFQRGDIHLAWMGGLTGVQARQLVPGARAVAQRDIDADFHSLFIANEAAGLEPFDTVAGLRSLAGRTLTYGSETSTSGRLMPQHFLAQAGLDEADLRGRPGFSGSHDATIEAVATGSFDVGAVNEQVFTAAEAAREVDLSDVEVLWRSPGYADYHWLVRPDVDRVFGDGTTHTVVDLLLGLDVTDPEDAEILELFGAERFIRADNSGYDELEAVARAQGLLG